MSNEAGEQTQPRVLRQVVIAVPATTQKELRDAGLVHPPSSRTITEWCLAGDRVVYTEQTDHGHRWNNLEGLVERIDAAQREADSVSPQVFAARRERFFSTAEGDLEKQTDMTTSSPKLDPLNPLFEQEKLKRDLEARLTQLSTAQS